MNTHHIATIAAYPNKFGSFTGAVLDKATKEVISERFETYDAARNWARSKSWEMFGPFNYAYIRQKGKNQYRANCWKSEA